MCGIPELPDWRSGRIGRVRSLVVESSDDEETFISKHGPTKPKTAFARFCHATKHKLPDEFKSLTGRDLRQHLSQLWKAADIQTKKPFEESLAADRIEYEAAMKKFKQGPFAEWKKTHPSSTSEESSSSDEDSSEDEYELEFWIDWIKRVT